MGRGFAGGGHEGVSAPHHEPGIRPMAFNHGNRFHDRDHRFFDHDRFVHHRFDHDRFSHHHNRFFFGFDFAAFGFPYSWYPYYWYPDDYYAYPDYSPVYDYRYWYGLGTAVQTQLAARGYYHGQIDGVIGPESRDAIRAFQQAQRLPVTGLIDPRLLKALNLPEVPRIT
jgi:Putative peptidoglycan binding domain